TALRLCSTLLLEALILRPRTARRRTALRLSSTLLLEALILRGLTLRRWSAGRALRPALAFLEALVLRGLTTLRRRPTGCALRPTLAFLEALVLRGLTALRWRPTGRALRPALAFLLEGAFSSLWPRAALRTCALCDRLRRDVRCDHLELGSFSRTFVAHPLDLLSLQRPAGLRRERRGAGRERRRGRGWCGLGHDLTAQRRRRWL